MKKAVEVAWNSVDLRRIMSSGGIEPERVYCISKTFQWRWSEKEFTRIPIGEPENFRMSFQRTPSRIPKNPKKGFGKSQDGFWRIPWKRKEKISGYSNYSQERNTYKDSGDFQTRFWIFSKETPINSKGDSGECKVGFWIVLTGILDLSVRDSGESQEGLEIWENWVNLLRSSKVFPKVFFRVTIWMSGELIRDSLDYILGLTENLSRDLRVQISSLDKSRIRIFV